MARKPKSVPLKGRKNLTQRGATSGADFVRERHRSIVQKNATTTTTRAERRAALFGHKENPPDGYKGLPSRSAASQGLPENSDEGRRLRFLSSLSRERTGRQTRDVQRNSRAHDDSRPIERSLTRAMTESKTNGASVNTRDKYNWASTPGQRHGLNESIDQPRDSIEERPRRKTNAPLVIPYTTPASEFLYGHSVVTMALKSSRRTFYKLYLYDGDAAEVRGQDKQVRKLALAANVEVTRVGNDWLKLMDKMSGGRPHNGYVLEASPLPKLPLAGLKQVPWPAMATRPTFDVTLDHQSREEAAVNGTETAVPYGTGCQRYPFLLLLDGIVSHVDMAKDPGNMGAIIRSSHFLGVDGIFICTRNSAALTPVALKAAAGAAETLPLYSVGQPASFIDESQENGWKFYAAVSPNSSDSGRAVGRPYYSSRTLGNPTRNHPCILVLGSEGDGLRWNIQKKADFMLGIEAQRTGSGELDSLNVSVASALLCDAFLRESITTGKSKTRGQMDQPDAVEEAYAGSTGADNLLNDHQRLF
ncbi:MAG: hypothetical protein Q9192_001384 [Flavoplaca navasiana]